METLASLFTLFLSFFGVGAAVAAIITILKLPGVLGWFTLLPDGAAGPVQILLNLAFFVAFVVGKLFWPGLNFEGMDAALQTYAGYAIQLCALIVQIWASTKVYMGVLKPAAPAIVSYSYRKAGLAGKPTAAVTGR